MRPDPLPSLSSHESKTFSQNGEDGILEWLLPFVRTKVIVEIGCGDWGENQSRNLVAKHGWQAKMYDKEDWITAENVNDLVRIPFGILSIDIDGNDYWIWKALKAECDVVCIEYNPWFGAHGSWTLKYDPNHHWDHTDNYGASLAALYQLGQSKGFQLVGCDSTGVNAFFVKKTEKLPDLTPEQAFVRVRGPKAGGIIDYSRMVIPQP